VWIILGRHALIDFCRARSTYRVGCRGQLGRYFRRGCGPLRERGGTCGLLPRGAGRFQGPGGRTAGRSYHDTRCARPWLDRHGPITLVVVGKFSCRHSPISKAISVRQRTARWVAGYAGKLFAFRDVARKQRPGERWDGPYQSGEPARVWWGIFDRRTGQPCWPVHAPRDYLFVRRSPAGTPPTEQRKETLAKQ